MFLQVSHDTVGQFLLRIFRMELQGKVDFPVFPDGLDVACGLVAWAKFLENFAFEQQAEMCAVDDGFVAQVGELLPQPGSDGVWYCRWCALVDPAAGTPRRTVLCAWAQAAG